MASSSAPRQFFQPAWKQRGYKSRSVAWPTARQILVVDLEATCWDTPTPPPGQKSEIIEIGWALVDLRSDPPSTIRDGTILVKPVKSEVSAFCTELTTITSELLEAEGVTIREAFKRLISDVGSQSVPWCRLVDTAPYLGIDC